MYEKGYIVNPSQKIKDNWKFCEVAFLVDRDDFLIDLSRVRRELGVSELIPYDKLGEWEEKELAQTSKEIKTRKVKSNYPWETYLVPSTKSEGIVGELQKKYHKAQNFWLVIQSAILTGTVTEDEFSTSAYCKVIYPEDYEHSAKVISPDTKLKEIEELFKTNLPVVIEEYKKFVLKTSRITPDTISNIKRDREWYWQKKNGLSYSMIEKKADPKVNKDVVIKAIKQYKARLAVEL